jgi:hypothetical protein
MKAKTRAVGELGLPAELFDLDAAPWHSQDELDAWRERHELPPIELDRHGPASTLYWSGWTWCHRNGIGFAALCATFGHVPFSTAAERFEQP